MSFKNMKLSTKQISGFLVIGVLLIIVGLVGYTSITQIEKNVTSLIKASPLIDAAMEMKLSVAADKQVVMEILAADDKTALDEVWKEHESLVKDFDTYADAILKGAETEEGTIYATTNPELKKIVLEADGFHNNEFQPRLKKLYDIKLQEYDLKKQFSEAMDKFESDFDKIIELAENFEGRVKDLIADKLASGSSAGEILSTENTWADMAMESKITIALSRIAIEEYAQSLEAESLGDIEKEYAESIKQFDVWMDALLNGAVTEEGRIAQVTDLKLKNMVIEIDKIHNDEFQVSASKLMEIQKRSAAAKAIGDKLDEEADEIGGKMSEMLGGIEVSAKADIDKATKDTEDVTSKSAVQLAIWIIIGFVSAVLLGFFISRSITKPINRIIADLTEGSSQVSSASGQISSSSQSLAEGATEQAASLEETSAALEEMSSQTKQNAENSDSANQLATETKVAAEDGVKSMTNMGLAMTEINESSGKISKIIKVIEEIAFQTNLLALNAAVEAARAGEAGKGFAVVAEEVRNLAQRSATAAKDTTLLIEESVSRAENGTKIAGEAGEALNKIVDNVKKMAGLVSQISGASKEQAEGVDQVSKAVTEMDKVTQTNAANAEETASASEELNAQAEQLNKVVTQLAMVVGGADSHVAAVPIEREAQRTMIEHHEKPALAVKPKQAQKTLQSSNKNSKQLVNPDDVIPMEDSNFKDF